MVEGYEMKGMNKKWFGLFLVLFTIFGLLSGVFLNVNNTYAANFSTSALRLYRRPVSSSSYSWTSDLAYNNLIYNTWSAKQYEFRSPSFIPTGNYATLHFETNLVYYEYTAYQNPWVNLNTIGVWCSASTGGVSVKSSIINTAVTHWYGDNNKNNTTLTVYGDVALQGFSSGSSTTLTCGVGSSDYAFLQVSPESLGTTNYFYFEQNPATIEFTNNLSDTLLQQQVSQNNTVINQNQTIIDQNKQTYDYLTDNTPPSADTSVLSGSAGWLPPGPVDSILTLPVQLAQGIVNVFTNPGQCTPLSLPLPWVDYNLEVPCVGPLMDTIGFTPIWGIIGGIISAFIIYDTLKWLYRFVDDTLTFRENNSTMWGGL